MKRRVLWRAAVAVAVLVATLTVAIHTPPVRRAALSRLVGMSGESLGVQLRANALNYNLFSGRFELEEASLRDPAVRELPPFLTADRVWIRVRYTSLLRGAFAADELRVEGLRLEGKIRKDGRGNIPPKLFESKGSKDLRLPIDSVVVGGFSLAYDDEQTGLALRLPSANLTITTEQPGGNQRVDCAVLTPGAFRSDGKALRVDQLKLDAVLQETQASVRALELTSAESRLRVQGIYRPGDSSRLDLSAEGDLDAVALSPWLGLTEPLAGRIRGRVLVSGEPSRLAIEGELRSDTLKMGPVRWDAVSTRARWDPAAGLLEWKDLRADMFGGRLTFGGRLAFKDAGETSMTAELKEFDLRRLPTEWIRPELPGGRASVRMTAAYPGLRWNQSRLTASAALRLNPGRRGIESSAIRGEFDGRLQGSRLKVHVVSISGHGTRLQGSVVLNTETQSLEGDLTATVRSVSELAHAVESDLGKPADSLLPFPIDGALEARVALSGGIRELGASAELTGTGVSAGRMENAKLQVRGGYGGGLFRIEQAQLDWRNQTATATGEFGMDSKSAPLRFEAGAENVSVTEILEGLALKADIQATADARVSLTGTVGEPRMNVRLEARDVSIYGEPLGSLSSEAQWYGGTLDVTRMRTEFPVETGKGTLEGRGSCNFDTRAYEFSLTGKDLRPTRLRLSEDAPVQGTVQLTAQGTGRLDDPAVQAEAELADLTVAGYTFGTARARLDIADHRAKLRVEGTTLEVSANGEVVLEQDYPFRFELSTSASAHPIAKAAGTLATIQASATIRGEGQLSPPELRQASALVKDLRLARSGTEAHADGPIDIRYAGGRLSLQPVTIVSGESRLEIAGGLPAEAGGEPEEISLAGKINLASIPSLLAAAGDVEVAGTASLEGSIRGSLRGLTSRAALKLEGGRVRHKAVPGALEDVQAEVKLQDGRINVEQVTARVGSGTVRASGDAPLEFVTQTQKPPDSGSHGPARFSLEMSKIPLSALFPLQDVTSGEFSLTLAGEAGAPTLGAIDARLELSEFSLHREAASVQLSGPSIFTVRNGEVRIERSHWKTLQSEMQLTGTLGLTGAYPLDVTLSGTGDASCLSLFSPRLESSGSLRLDLRARGTLRNPVFAGTIDLKRGTIGVRQPRLVAEDLEFGATIDGGRIDIRKLTGILNEGRLQGGGSITFQQGKLENVQIDLGGQDVFLEYPVGLKTALDLDINVSSRDSTLVIGGEMNIREGSYLDPFDFSQARSEALDFSGNQESSGKLELLGSRVVYDIGVRTRQPIVIDNNLARLSGKVDVRLVGDLLRPGMRGKVTLDRGGKVYFGGRTYNTERGVVTFASDTRLEPVFDVVATAQVNDYLVTLRLVGTGTEVTITFTSDPPLSQNDVVALLLTGRPASESGGSRVDPAQAERMSVLTGALNADLSGRMRRRFGVSQVMIQPGLVNEESDPGARLTVGQNLSDSLQLVYSMNLVNSADQLWYLEYDLQRRFTARAVKQSDNTYRTDFQQDLRFGGPRSGSGVLSSSGAPKLKIGKVEFTGNPVLPESTLAKEFKLGPGSQFTFARSHKGLDRLTKLYSKKDYLEARIQMDRTDENDLVNLAVQIEAGQPVKFAYSATGISGSTRKMVRTIWQGGISDRQRLGEAEDRLRLQYAKQGYLQAKAAGKVTTEADGKRVEFDIQLGTRFPKVQTVFEGATSEHAEAMGARIRQRKLTDQIYLDPAKVAQDLTAYYRQQGNYLARVEPPRFDLDPGSPSAKIVFPVTEGPQVRVGKIEFAGNKNLTDSQLAEKLPLAQDKVLEPGLVQKSVAAILDLYGRNGYRNPDIEPRLKLNEEQSSVDIAFSIQEGVRTYVRSLEVSGQNRVSEKFVREQLRIGEKEPQNFPQTSQSIRNLYNTGAFSNVSIESTPDKDAAAKDSGTETVDLAVKVQEVSPYKVRYGGYFDSGRGPGVIFDIENRNSLGNARVLGLRTRYDKDLQEARLYLTQPLFRTHQFPTTGTLYFRRENDYYEGLSAQRVGLTLQQEAMLKKKLILSYGLRVEDVYTWYPDKRAPNPPRELVSPLLLSLTKNTRDDFLDPTRGSFTSTAIEYAPGLIGNHTAYMRFFGQYFKYFPLFKPDFAPFQGEVRRPRTVFATGARVGLLRSSSSQPIIPTERFYAGGGTTVRGFEQDTLGPLDQYGDPIGGNAMLVLNNELRFPVVSVLDGVGFVDIGNVFPTVSDFKLSELRKTAGLGLRLRIPGLMLRFDYGLKLDRRPGESRGAFFFSIGQAF